MTTVSASQSHLRVLKDNAFCVVNIGQDWSQSHLRVLKAIDEFVCVVEAGTSQSHLRVLKGFRRNEYVVRDRESQSHLRVLKGIYPCSSQILFQSVSIAPAGIESDYTMSMSFIGSPKSQSHLRVLKVGVGFGLTHALHVSQSHLRVLKGEGESPRNVVEVLVSIAPAGIKSQLSFVASRFVSCNSRKWLTAPAGTPIRDRR